MRQVGRDHAPGDVGSIHQFSVASVSERHAQTIFTEAREREHTHTHTPYVLQRVSK
jgi:hypothetical protein